MKKEMKRTARLWMLFAVITLVVVGCTDDNINPTTPEKPDEPEEVVKTASEVLKEIEGVSDIKEEKDEDGNSVTSFYFKQPIDHKNPAAGTFVQYCVLHYKGSKHTTVMHTHGYSITTSKNAKVRQLELAKILDANYLAVEHRYYYRSTIGLSEEDTNKGISSNKVKADYWKYNTAEQSTADLHNIVTALKKSGYFDGKWVSSGVSKNGILTALYAYFYPNDMDVYVPFCAPFCDGAETTGIGKWLTNESGGKELQKDVWNVLERMTTDEDLREELVKLYKEEHGDDAKIKKYSTSTAMLALTYDYMANMFYKFCYRPTDEWDGVIPNENSSAELYYGFITLGKTKYWERLKNLRQLWDDEELKGDDDYEDEIDDDYEDEEDWDFDEDDDPMSSRRAASSWTLKFHSFLNTIYFVHAASELGYFLYDWTILPENHLLSDSNIKWLKNKQTITRYNKWYDVKYDDRMMKSFLDFVKNNRTKDKCKMLFVYGGNDPWTGAAIPDPDKDDPCVKKYVVPKGTHNAFLTNPEYYRPEDKDYIVNTVKEWLKD